MAQRINSFLCHQYRIAPAAVFSLCQSCFDTGGFNRSIYYFLMPEGGDRFRYDLPGKSRITEHRAGISFNTGSYAGWFGCYFGNGFYGLRFNMRSIFGAYSGRCNR